MFVHSSTAYAQQNIFAVTVRTVNLLSVLFIQLAPEIWALKTGRLVDRSLSKAALRDDLEDATSLRDTFSVPRHTIKRTPCIIDR